MRTLLLASIALQGAVSLAQNVFAMSHHPLDQQTAQQIGKQAVDLLAEAQKSPSGLATARLESYPGHLTSLTARVKSGGPELHKNVNDIFVVVDGEATQMVGGTLKDPKEVSPGEWRGSVLEGAEGHVMRKGDVIHISPDVPHQTMLAPGKTFVYYVIKVDAPK